MTPRCDYLDRLTFTAASLLRISRSWQSTHTYGCFPSSAFLLFCIVADIVVPHWQVMFLHVAHRNCSTSSSERGKCRELSGLIALSHFLRLQFGSRHTAHVLHVFELQGGLQHRKHRVLRVRSERWCHIEGGYPSFPFNSSHKSHGTRQTAQ